MFAVEKGFMMPSHMYGIGDAICQYQVNLPDMSLTDVSLESQCFLVRLSRVLVLSGTSLSRLSAFWYVSLES